jgi:hypothetical protein
MQTDCGFPGPRPFPNPASTNTVGDAITEEYNRLADMCPQAKERMMEAETDDALEVAIRRVNIICDD